jgi:hypothetical protein
MEKTKKIINNVVFYSGISLTLAGAIYGAKQLNKQADIAANVRQQSICPALLSISRSARDTLIVMKAEPLCNGFVLDSLK